MDVYQFASGTQHNPAVVMWRTPRGLIHRCSASKQWTADDVSASQVGVQYLAHRWSKMLVNASGCTTGDLSVDHLINLWPIYCQRSRALKQAHAHTFKAPISAPLELRTTQRMAQQSAPTMQKLRHCVPGVPESSKTQNVHITQVTCTLKHQGKRPQQRLHRTATSPANHLEDFYELDTYVALVSFPTSTLRVKYSTFPLNPAPINENNAAVNVVSPSGCVAGICT